MSVALEARDVLAGEGIRARVVSMPSWALFSQQSKEYRDQVLPPSRPRPRQHRGRAPHGVAPLGGERGRGDRHQPLRRQSAPAKRVFQELGLSAENVVAKAKLLLGMGDGEAEKGRAGRRAGGARDGREVEVPRVRSTRVRMVDWM